MSAGSEATSDYLNSIRCSPSTKCTAHMASSDEINQYQIMKDSPRASGASQMNYDELQNGRGPTLH